MFGKLITLTLGFAGGIVVGVHKPVADREIEKLKFAVEADRAGLQDKSRLEAAAFYLSRWQTCSRIVVQDIYQQPCPWKSRSLALFGQKCSRQN